MRMGSAFCRAICARTALNGSRRAFDIIPKLMQSPADLHALGITHKSFRPGQYGAYVGFNKYSWWFY